MERDEHCRKFLDRILPESFRKLLSSNATLKWNAEIQEGIYVMSELYIETITARLEYDPVPNKLLETLSLVSFIIFIFINTRNCYNSTIISMEFNQIFDINVWYTVAICKQINILLEILLNLFKSLPNIKWCQETSQNVRKSEKYKLVKVRGKLIGNNRLILIEFSLSAI